MKAGFIGTGSMGLPLAMNILDQEKSLVVFDINEAAVAPLAAKQARVVASPAEVANEAEIVFACMPSLGSFEAIVSGPDGVMQGRQMSLFVNLGTMGTEATIHAETLLAGKGVEMLDSPITGGVKRASDGDITVITSGPQAVYDKAEPFLRSFAREIHYVGDKVGQAQLTKVCNNIMSFSNLIAGVEALIMAAKGGVDPEKVLAVINAGSGQNSATLTKIPNYILNRRFKEMQAPMHITEKDAMLWRMEAERLQVPQNVGSAAYQTLQQGIAMGLRPADWSEIVKVVERAADFELPKTRD
jgi:3-hydroxyisobutyrate dehydrogenase-like beta-hydroxyacid dehydrogenase